MLCTGNLCRSPIAEALFRHYLHQAGEDAQVLSRGLWACEGEPPHRNVLTIAAREYVEIDERRRATTVARADVVCATLVLTMDRPQRFELIRRYPQASGKVFLLDPQAEVPDPLGQSEQVFETVWHQIDRGVRDWLGRLRKMDLLRRSGGVTA
ncbi:low molecular weight protein-tyrosine-phosphatase [Bordetella ansorpii]|uniref:protein-tyrosine-phosphatase n=1 Tax=Bordetella ansorpii TaxID=288768 RepID=A0A146AY31_9BORD|nr:hypothetical protein [Bordetella ansorpii]CZZ94190.1 low molecular weight protein-tyrosine-phosphatase [Bordetella ansorpii]